MQKAESWLVVVISLILLILLGLASLYHWNQRLIAERIVQEQNSRREVEARIVGWWRQDKVTKELYYEEKE